MTTKVYAEAEILKIPVQAALEVDPSNSTTKFVVDGNGDSTTTFTLTELVTQLRFFGSSATETTIEDNLPVTFNSSTAVQFNLDKVFIAGKYDASNSVTGTTKYGFKISVNFGSADNQTKIQGKFFDFKYFSFVVYSNLDGHDDILDKLNISEVNRLLKTYVA